MPFDPDTKIGGASAKFPLTRHSAIVSMRSDDAEERERAWSAVVDSYWKPAYKYIRIQWNKSNEDAKDLTQLFFTTAMQKDYFRSYTLEKGSFRNFLRTCLDGFLNNQDQASKRLKRGGGSITVPLDFESAEGELQELPVSSSESTEDFFHKEWVRHLFASAVSQLHQECDAAGKRQHFAMFEKYDLDQTATAYEELAREFGLPVTTVTNHLAWTRRQFRRIVLDRIRDVSGSEEEFRREARDLLGGTRFEGAGR